ncbi:ComEA family DNA-binding protein [Chitinophaga qingshengii]|uniref:Helix-hairpin-helix domain-containing protein n=1 Tax=Chitinophaga qingshengii TaxID=1569794 RepID=A0ABR7TVX5_9BACT|nr:helix-hairpin-helix domain-containing protein [Chitinophaga qingshengii]MBC9934577.1 helix-hairpin-helix domain-containing protein [Chitinophaga qingshengii]
MAAGWCRITGVLLLLCGSWEKAAARQEPLLPAVLENALENETAATDATSEDDEDWQQLEDFMRHKIQLNTADEATLQSLGVLTDIQVQSFLTYRRLLGNLVSIYELQAVPGFEPELIRQLLPYVKVGNDLMPHYNMHDYLHKGGHSLLLRYGRQLEKARGYLGSGTAPPAYQGSPDKLLLRYRYSFPRYISWGITMEKDPGEPWGGFPRQHGFDYYSAHVFVHNIGALKTIALGDYTVNLGQGLLQWQAQAYGKGAAPMLVKRQGDILRPHTSAGENDFFRGAAATWAQRAWQATAFVSFRRLDGTVTAGDSLEDNTATALQRSGYHRTVAELLRKGTVQQWSGGGNVRYQRRRWQLGANMVTHRLSPSLQKELKPYNQFEFMGTQLTAASMDYAAYWQNVHFFGEAAASDNGKPAFVQGALASVTPAVDVSMIYRYYDKAYQSFYAKGFGDGYRTVNEQGWYTGISLLLSPRWKMEGYADFFHFPWLKYRADAPSEGHDFSLQAIYTPNKRQRWLARVSSATHAENSKLPGNALKVLTDITLMHVRIQGEIAYGRSWQVKGRAEYSRYQAAAGNETGWMCYVETAWRPQGWPLTLDVRLARFGTGGYNSRIYAYERSVLYDNAVSMFYGNGWQYYLNAKWKAGRHLSCWLRVNQAIYPGKQVPGTSMETVTGSTKTRVQLQLLRTW